MSERHHFTQLRSIGVLKRKRRNRTISIIPPYFYGSLIIIADSLHNDYANITRIESCKTITILLTRQFSVIPRDPPAAQWSQRHEMAGPQNSKPAI